MHYICIDTCFSCIWTYNQLFRILIINISYFRIWPIQAVNMIKSKLSKEELLGEEAWSEIQKACQQTVTDLKVILSRLEEFQTKKLQVDQRKGNTFFFFFFISVHINIFITFRCYDILLKKKLISFVFFFLQILAGSLLKFSRGVKIAHLLRRVLLIF